MKLVSVRTAMVPDNWPSLGAAVSGFDGCDEMTDPNSDETRGFAKAVGTHTQAVYLTYPREDEVRIDLVAMARAIWGRKWIIIGVACLFTAASAAYALLATPVYRAEAVLITNNVQDSPSISAGLGDLASLAGISFGTTADDTEALASLSSRALVEEFIEEEQLLSVLFADEWDAEKGEWKARDPADWPNVQDGVELFVEDVRFVDQDPATGLVTLAVEWRDPEMAVNWVNGLVLRVNERLRSRDLENSQRRLKYLYEELDRANFVDLRQAISRLIENEIQTVALARTQTEYAFRVIDPPRVPNDQIAPERGPVIALGTVLGLMVGLSVALFRGWASWARRLGSSSL